MLALLSHLDVFSSSFLIRITKKLILFFYFEICTSVLSFLIYVHTTGIYMKRIEIFFFFYYRNFLRWPIISWMYSTVNMYIYFFSQTRLLLPSPRAVGASLSQAVSVIDDCVIPVLIFKRENIDLYEMCSCALSLSWYRNKSLVKAPRGMLGSRLEQHLISTWEVRCRTGQCRSAFMLAVFPCCCCHRCYFCLPLSYD
jgi:hypothetical protein